MDALKEARALLEDSRSEPSTDMGTLAEWGIFYALLSIAEDIHALCTEAAFKGEPFKALRTIDETPRKYKV